MWVKPLNWRVAFNAFAKSFMAIKSTIFKANVQIADIDHNYYADHALTLARHPSETDERMMVRLVALSLQAHQLQDMCHGDGVLGFGAGLSDPDEPDVMLRDFTGRTRLYVFSHSGDVWWKGIQTKLTRPSNLQVWRIPSAASQSLTTLAERSMQLQATIQEGALMLSNSQTTVHIECERWL